MAFGDPNDPATIAFAKANGMSVSDVASLAQSMGGGSGTDPNDPPVIVGIDPNVTTVGGRKRYGAEIPQTKPLSQYLTDFYGMTKEQLTTFQTRAYQAGLYGNATPRYGDPNDDVAFGIWSDIGKRAAGFAAAGQHFSTADVLDMAVQSGAGQQKLPKHAYETRTDVVSSTDPAAIRAAAHEAFKAVTGKGRAVDDRKIAKFVEVFTAHQVAPQRAVNAAQDKAATAARAAQDTADAGGTPTQGPVSQEVRTVSPDLGSQAAEFAQASDPAAAGAHGIATQFNSFLRLLGGVV